VQRRCNGGEAGTNDWGAVEEEEEKICDAVWRMIGEEKIAKGLRCCEKIWVFL